MNTFLTSNKLQFRLLRTVIQALIGFLVDNIAQIVAMTQFDGSTQAVIVSGTMVILTGIMKFLGTEDEKDRDKEKGLNHGTIE